MVQDTVDLDCHVLTMKTFMDFFASLWNRSKSAWRGEY